jgi:hypothetical protein
MMPLLYRAELVQGPDAEYDFSNDLLLRYAAD